MIERKRNLRYLDTFWTQKPQGNMTWRSTHESTRETNRTNVVFVARNLSRWVNMKGVILPEATLINCCVSVFVFIYVYICICEFASAEGGFSIE